jgi:hypothetical protein
MDLHPMSRTHHHSERWGPEHRRAPRFGRPRRILASRIGEAPGWFVRMCDKRPGRFADQAVIRLILAGKLDPDAATFRRNGSRKPHTYYW